MNLIQKSLAEVRFNIPREVLDYSFIDADHARSRLPVSTETRIREQVIDARVKPDCNIVGGLETTVDLSQVVPEYLDVYRAVFRIPKRLTQGRSISSVLSLTFGVGAVMANTTLGVQGQSPMLDAANSVLQSHLPVPIVSTAAISLIAENTVLVEDNMALPMNMFLRCIIDNDENLSNINPRSYLKFTNLVVLATKAHIFQNAIIRLDVGFIQGGQTIGRIREVIDGYADANEMYYDYLENTWRGVAFLNDTQAKRRHLRSLVGGGN